MSRRPRRPSSPAREARELLRRVAARYDERDLDFEPNPGDADDLDAGFRAVELHEARDDGRRREREGLVE